jgi:hypothetical protein
MKPATLTGIIPIALSVLSFAYQGIPYKTREKVSDLGPIYSPRSTDVSENQANSARKLVFARLDSLHHHQ